MYTTPISQYDSVLPIIAISDAAAETISDLHWATWTTTRDEQDATDTMTTRAAAGGRHWRVIREGDDHLVQCAYAAEYYRSH